MRCSLLLPFLGSVLAAPTAPSQPLSPFDNPFIPFVDASELGIPVDPPLVRRVDRGAPVVHNRPMMNVSSCYVRLVGEVGRNFRGNDLTGTLVITDRIQSPGTKNDVNPFDMNLVSSNMQISTNGYVSNFPTKMGTNWDDFARFTLSAGGYTLAYLDDANVPFPQQPNIFTTQMRSSDPAIFLPAITCHAFGSSYIAIKFDDKGGVEGGVLLEGASFAVGSTRSQAGRYFARFTGSCLKSVIPYYAPIST